MEKKTKSIAITQYDYIISNVNDEEIDIHGHPNHYSEFDTKGNPLKETRFNSRGEFEEMFEYGYDDKGNLVRESYYLEENEVAEVKTFAFDDAGRVIRALKHYQDGSVDTIAFYYDEENQLIKRTTTTDEGEVELVEIYEWEGGVLKSYRAYDESGGLIPEQEETIKPGQTRVTRNEKGQILTEEELDADGEVYMTVNRSYDEDGLANEVDVVIDGQGRTISRHYILKYEYTFFE